MAFLGSISNPNNETLKNVRTLRDKKRARYQEKRYMIEGLRLVAHALQSGYRPALAFYSETFASTDKGQAVLKDLSSAPTSIWAVTDDILASLSDTVTPQGIIAIMPMPEPQFGDIAEGTLLLVLDNIRDPGNLGTMLRTAQAAGVDATLLSTGCVDPYSPKVVRAGMGAHFELSIWPGLSWAEIAGLVRGKQCILADADGERTVWEVDWTLPSVLIVGSEAHGAGPDAHRLADQVARLPMRGEAESLNVAIATAAFLFEARRQRRYGEGALP